MLFGRDRLRAFTALANSFALFVLVSLLPVPPAFAANVSLAWNPVVNAALVGYMVHHGPSAGSYTTSIDVGNTVSYTVTNLVEGATYHFAVTAYDAAHNQSGLSTDVLATVSNAVPVADFTGSTTSGPSPLAMNFINSTTGTIVTYAWTFGDGTTSSVVNPAHVYSTAGVYTVGLTVTGPGGSSTKTRANYITVTGPDTSPPTAPSSLTATASGTSTINLAWSASADNAGVTGYRVERCQGATCTTFTQIATPTGTTFSSTGLAAATTYRYRVRANDAAGNLSGYSPIATATTTTTAGDTSPPSAPSNLTATASGTGTINLAWSASADNVGVTGYLVDRCQGATCTGFLLIATPTGTTLGNSGLAAATTYRYQVRAIDAAGNRSGYSPIATATSN